MSRLVPSIAAVMAAVIFPTCAAAADWAMDEPDLRGAFYSGDPKDWTELGDQTDTVAFEFGLRYWYSWGAQSFSTSGGTTTANDQSHIGEMHLRIEDHSTNTYAKALAGYSVAISGDYSGPLVSGTTSDGQIGYIGADLGWNAFGDNNGSGVGALVGYQYWNNSPNTGRNSFTTATSAADITYDPATGQTFVPGDSAPNHVDIHMLRLGVQGKANLGGFFDITAELAAVPYSKVSGVVGVDDPTFSTAEYAGPAQLPYASVANGNIASIRSSTTAIDGWGYGAMAEAWVGMHPTENITFRLGGRAWYLQGTVDATYTAAQIGDPSDADLDGTYDTAPVFVNQGFISIANPFSLFRYGLLAELTYSF